MPKPISRWLVTGLFCVLYAAFLIETVALFVEFAPFGLAIPFSTLFAHNFLFFPVVGLLALIAFWRPAVLITDALLFGRVKYGRAALVVVVMLVVGLTGLLSSTFGATNSRSLFEIAPATLVDDQPVESADPALRRAAIPEILIKMKINASDEEGLSRFQANCDPEWLEYAVVAAETQLCFPTGTKISVAQCCQAKTRFREFVNTVQVASPSTLSTVHRAVLPFKTGFLLALLAIGILLVRMRTSLTGLYGAAVQEVSFPIAVGGALMLLWPLMNASYLDTFALVTADGASNAYRVSAPLYALGFGIWAMLLVFFHLRTYPSQVETALKAAGVVIAAFGVLQYEQILTYLSQTLGVGGSIVAVIVFAVAIGALITTLVLGIKPPEFLDPSPKEEAEEKA